MGRWAPQHDTRERQACIRAHLDGTAAAAIVRAAAAGELEDGLEPFAVSESAVRQWAKKAQLKNPGPAPAEPDPPPEPDPIDTRVRHIAEKTIDRIEALDKPAGKDLADLRTAYSIIDDVNRRQQRRNTRRKSRARDGNTDAASDLAQRLLAADHEPSPLEQRLPDADQG
jgi:hypothetical protein